MTFDGTEEATFADFLFSIGGFDFTARVGAVELAFSSPLAGSA